MHAWIIALLSNVPELAAAAGRGAGDATCTDARGLCTKSELLSLVQIEARATVASTGDYVPVAKYEFLPNTLCSKRHASREKLHNSTRDSAIMKCDEDPSCIGVADYLCDGVTYKLCRAVRPEHHQGFVSYEDLEGCVYKKPTTLKVDVYQGRKIPKRDILSQTDTYVKVTACWKTLGKTDVQKNDRNPVWNWQQFGTVDPSCDKVTFTLNDWDKNSGDDLIAEKTINFREVNGRKSFDIGKGGSFDVGVQLM
eukprot:TRINITY_DN2633_c0_g1_i1.p1 TRINITY_DN2633_c0_g1~~TRINITY_DN2633_c0_g1_i1.p1  ORF type:complete len:282 (+),score=23.65 TRINITY_DN2633_c0_g1_i1:90-848(+)